MDTAKLTKQRWIVLDASCPVNLYIGAIYVWSVFAGAMAARLTKITKRATRAADLAIIFFGREWLLLQTMIGGAF